METVGHLKVGQVVGEPGHETVETRGVHRVDALVQQLGRLRQHLPTGE